MSQDNLTAVVTFDAVPMQQVSQNIAAVGSVSINGDDHVSFSGWLELLAILESALLGRQSASLDDDNKKYID